MIFWEFEIACLKFDMEYTGYMLLFTETFCCSWIVESY